STFYKNSKPNEQHFAFFQDKNVTGTFYVGVEDLPGPKSDFDYNDFVFKVQAVPEPGSMTMFGLGFVGLAGLRLRRRK
ncbi:DUF4114 domain-containing protein, partial [Acinetobacter baumannii]